jgi:squalene synthase HpnC
MIAIPARLRRMTVRPTAPAGEGRYPNVAALHRRARGENFTVASLLLPRRTRRHLMSLYAFARLVDDIGDAAPGDRTRLLDRLSQELDDVFTGAATAQRFHRELAAAIHECRIPREPFDRLILANLQDQAVHRYPTFDSLLGYCALSANPVGHLVLHVFGVATVERMDLSNRVCTALQVLEHCQDVAEDLRQDRIYLPTEDLDRFGVGDADLRAPCASRKVRALLAFETQRALRLLEEGSALVERLSGAARVAVAGYLAGGLATAASIASARFDVLASTPRPRPARIAGEWIRLLVPGGA